MVETFVPRPGEVGRGGDRGANGMSLPRPRSHGCLSAEDECQLLCICILLLKRITTIFLFFFFACWISCRHPPRLPNLVFVPNQALRTARNPAQQVSIWIILRLGASVPGGLESSAGRDRRKMEAITEYKSGCEAWLLGSRRGRHNTDTGNPLRRMGKVCFLGLVLTPA